jgi:large subunit ribosomal protein L3
MPHRDASRRGSLAYLPRKRAKRIYPKTKAWVQSKEAKPLGFAGWKAGMTHIQFQDSNAKSPTFGRLVSKPVTIIDAPSLFVCAIRFYKKSDSGFKTVSEKWTKTFPKGLDIKRKILPSANPKDVNVQKFDNIKLIVATQTEHSGMKKQKPDLFELGIGGKLDDKLKYAETVLGKTIDVKDVFKAGEYVDVAGVTKGSGYTGVVKRYGVRVQTRKDKQMHRHVGSIGSTVPRKVDWRVPQAGQFGYLTRTEFGKRVVAVDDDSKKITPDGGFVRYGQVKNFILIEGSVPGPKKRLIRLRKSVRVTKIAPLDIRFISVGSKQG